MNFKLQMEYRPQQTRWTGPATKTLFLTGIYTQLPINYTAKTMIFTELKTLNCEHRSSICPDLNEFRTPLGISLAANTLDRTSSKHTVYKRTLNLIAIKYAAQTMTFT